MSITNRVINYLKERRQKVLNGGINCIPSPFVRFRRDFVGVEQGKYYLVSGLAKSAKTQLTSYLFLYNSILYSYRNPDKLKLTIFYYPLEETAEAITLRFMSFLLYTLSHGKVRKSSMDLKSTNENNVLDEECLNLLESEEYQKLLNYFEETVTFLPDRNPTGIYKTIKRYADNNGRTINKTIKIKNKETGVEEEQSVFDYYIPDNPNEYVLIIVDHVSLLESERGLDLRQTINKLSEYMILVRNRYNYTPVLIQQQSVNLHNFIFLLIFAL